MEKSIKNKKYKKIVKKVLTKLFEGGIVILVLKKRAKQKNELWKLNSRLIYRIETNKPSQIFR